MQGFSPLPSTPSAELARDYLSSFLLSQHAGDRKEAVLFCQLPSGHTIAAPCSWDLPNAQKKATARLWILGSLNQLFCPWTHRSAIRPVPGLLQGVGWEGPWLNLKHALRQNLEASLSWTVTLTTVGASNTYSWCSGTHNAHSYQVLECCACPPGSLLGVPQTRDTGF